MPFPFFNMKLNITTKIKKQIKINKIRGLNTHNQDQSSIPVSLKIIKSGVYPRANNDKN
jgi:hypothetical protein